MNRYRYPGAQPFNSDQKDIFFGRENDIRALSRLIRLEPLVVLYSKSGLGKSSLINAGILPLLEKEAKLLPISIRFNAYNPSDESLNAPVITTTKAVKVRLEHQPSFLSSFLPEEDSLWYTLKDYQAIDPKKKIVLIFDQFEELFTYPEDAIIQFKQELSEVLNTNIPQRFREIVEDEVEQKDKLSKKQLSLVHQPFTTKVVFAIRSDRVSLLDKIADYLPLVKRHWYELDALNELEAEDAILNPAYKKGDFLSPVFDYSDEAIEKVLEYLTKGHNTKIESFQLQILCQAMERKVINEGLEKIKSSHLGNIQEIYENYYEDQINLIEDEEEQLAARKFIEEGLILEEEERRLSLYEGQIYKQYQISEDLLRKLTYTHLIRREPSMVGGYTYELSHDTLVPAVLKAKDKRLEIERIEKQAEEQRKRELELIAAKEKAEKEFNLRRKAEENEKKAKLRTKIAAVVSFIAIASAITALISYNKLNEKEQELKITNNELEESKDSLVVEKDNLAKVIDQLKTKDKEKALTGYKRELEKARQAIRARNYVKAQNTLENAMGFIDQYISDMGGDESFRNDIDDNGRTAQQLIQEVGEKANLQPMCENLLTNATKFEKRRKFIEAKADLEKALSNGCQSYDSGIRLRLDNLVKEGVEYYKKRADGYKTNGTLPSLREAILLYKKAIKLGGENSKITEVILECEQKLQ